jgi:hypothetical protein
MKLFLKQLAFLSAFLIFSIGSYAQNPLNYDRAGWLAKAEELKPQLTETIITPTGIVEMTTDSLAFQDWKATKIAGIDSLYNH